MAKTQDENLITYTLGDTSIAAKISDRMHFNHIPQTSVFPRLLFTRTGAMREGCLDDASGAMPATHETFLLEVNATTPEDAEDLRKLLETRLNAPRVTFGDVTAHAVLAEDQTSRHEPRGTGADQGIHYATLAVEVIVA